MTARPPVANQPPLLSPSLLKGGCGRLWPLAALVVLAGYFAPWVNHSASGLVITGLDLGETVKFLPAVREGSINLWRQGFYLPLFTISLSCALLAYRPYYQYAFALRLALLLAGAVVALNMLPPAWSPAVLSTLEFRLQTIAIIFCLAATAFSPLLGRLPARAVYAPLLLLSFASMALPSIAFLRVLPEIADLYRRALTPGWGFYVMLIGLTVLAIACVQAARLEHRAFRTASATQPPTEQPLN